MTRDQAGVEPRRDDLVVQCRHDDLDTVVVGQAHPVADRVVVGAEGVIRFANPAGFDFPYLLSMLHDSFMSRANTLVVPGGKMELAMQLIFTPMILRLMERRKKAYAI